MSLSINDLSENERAIIEEVRKVAKSKSDLELRNKNDGTFKILVVKRELRAR